MPTTITIKQLTTPIGIVTAGATEKGLCMLEFGEKTEFKTTLDYISEIGEHKFINETEKQLIAYFNNERTVFDIPLDLIGTDFQISVWNELLNIPFGKTRSYKEQAIAIGNLKAIRAVATANGANRIPIIIPCHRIIGSDGSLTGFSGGLWRKKFLLELESKQTNLFN
ncbi:MAG: methylated-DNA--[protein]-cysteine S-methyltransferase [Vicingaceae bacterium]|nr:methylated-DNA--[protein]-cysteine S-methyltransferase [Vicingaceae bacterium]